MKHMGQTLREAIDKEGIIITHLATKVFGKNSKTKTLYNWFGKEILPWEKVERIAAHYPRILLYFPDRTTNSMVVSESASEYTAMLDYKRIAQEWEQKYYITLGKLTECQEMIKKG